MSAICSKANKTGDLKPSISLHGLDLDRNKSFRLWILAFLIFLAFFLRAFRIDSVPPGLWYDEAINGLDALSTLEHAPRIFYTTEGHPREPLLIYLISLAFLPLKPTATSLRLVSALIGALTIPLLYWFVRQCTRDISLALLSAFFLAVMRWHVHFSRLSFRTILVPPLLILVCGFLIMALQSDRLVQRRRSLVLSGVFLGIGFYSYLAFRLVPLIIVLMFLYEIVFRRSSLKESLRDLAFLIIPALLISSPLIFDYIVHPDHFTGRTQEVSLFDKGFDHAVRSALENCWSVALMFSFKGDHVPKHNIPFKPLFDPFISTIFYIGLGVAIGHALKRQSLFFASITLWFFILLAASVFSFGSPNLLRTLGASPAVAIILSTGLLFLGRLLLRVISFRAVIALIILICLVFSSIQVKQYFIDWYRLPATWRDFNSNIADLATFSNNLPREKYALFIPSDLLKHPTFRFLNRNERTHASESLEQLLSNDRHNPRLIVATTYGDLFNSGILQSLPAVKQYHEIATYGYGVWAYIFIISPEDVLSPDEVRELLNRQGIDSKKLRLYY